MRYWDSESAALFCKFFTRAWLWLYSSCSCSYCFCICWTCDSWSLWLCSFALLSMSCCSSDCILSAYSCPASWNSSSMCIISFSSSSFFTICCCDAFSSFCSMSIFCYRIASASRLAGTGVASCTEGDLDVSRFILTNLDCCCVRMSFSVFTFAMSAYSRFVCVETSRDVCMTSF